MEPTNTLAFFATDIDDLMSTLKFGHVDTDANNRRVEFLRTDASG